eukprot:scaffold16.g16.t1
MGREALAVRWRDQSYEWARCAASASGAEPGLVLLGNSPLLAAASPAWARAPSYAAAAILAPPGAPLAELVRPPTLRARLLWSLGAADIFWAACFPYRYTARQRAQLQPLALRYTFDGPSAGGNSSSGDGSDDEAARPRRWRVLATRRRRQAARLFRGLAADMHIGALRAVGWLMCKTFRVMFGGALLVDAAGLQRLRELQPDKTLVIVATHRSHVDYLILSWLLFTAGLPCPHIAAGINLSLPLVSRLLRACGAFFIRRSNGGADAEMYKRVLAGYVHALLREGQLLEWFIEGGRSRDGRVNPPKLGLLSYVVDAQLAGDLPKGVVLVPTTVSFDRVLEERALVAQLAGAPKRRESLGGLLAACWGVVRAALADRGAGKLGLGAGGICGRAAVRFGEPIDLERFLQERPEVAAGGAPEHKAAVAELGEALTAALRRSSALPTSALLVGALFMRAALAGSGLAAAEGTTAGVCAALEWLAGELRERGAACVSLPAAHAGPHLRRLGGLLGGCVGSLPAEDGGQVLALARGWEARLRQHMRLNQLLPWLAPEGLVAAALLACAAAGQRAGVDEVLEGAAWLRRFLVQEMDAAVGPGALQTAADFEPVVAAMERRGQVVALVTPSPAAAGGGGGKGRPPAAVPAVELRIAAGGAPRQAALLAALLLCPLVVTYAAVLQAVVLELTDAGGGTGGGGASSKALQAAARAALLAAADEERHPFVVPSGALVQGALATLRSLGVLVAAPPRREASSQALPAVGEEGEDGGGGEGDEEGAVPGPLPRTESQADAAAAQLMSVSGSALEAVVAESTDAGLCQLADGSPASSPERGRRGRRGGGGGAETELLVLGPAYRSVAAVQALLNRLHAYMPL